MEFIVEKCGVILLMVHKKAMLIDTAFGLGDLKGLIHKLIGDKEIIVCNTHCHIDHVSGK